MLRRIGLLLCLLLLGACRQGIHEDFTQSFVEANRGMDDDAWAAGYSPEMKVLAVGRDSGWLELWDAREPDVRLTVQGHELRTQGLAFGPEDGIVITNSASGNRDFGDLVQLESARGAGVAEWSRHAHQVSGSGARTA